MNRRRLLKFGMAGFGGLWMPGTNGGAALQGMPAQSAGLTPAHRYVLSMNRNWLYGGRSGELEVKLTSRRRLGVCCQSPGFKTEIPA